MFPKVCACRGGRHGSMCLGKWGCLQDKLLEVGLLDPECHLVTLRRSLCSHILKEAVPPPAHSSNLSGPRFLCLVTSLPLSPACGFFVCLPFGVEVRSAGSGSQLSVGLNFDSGTCWLNGHSQEACLLWASVSPSIKCVHLSAYFWKSC